MKALSRSALLPCLAVLAAGACGDMSSSARRTVHPTPENVPAVGSVIHSAGSEPVSGALAHWARVLRDAALQREVGRPSGDADDVIGLVEDIVRLPGGEIVVLDSRFNVLRLFSQAGRALWVGSGPGRGPGELSRPLALGIMHSADGPLVGVLDRGRTISTYSQDGDTLLYAGGISIDVTAGDLCVAGDNWIVQGSRAGAGVVHEVREDGSLRSMGELYSTDDWLVEGQLSDGPVGCMSGAGPLLSVRKNFPFVWAIDPPTGDVQWVAEIAGFEQIGVVSYIDTDGRPAVAFGGDHVWDAIHRIIPMGTTSFALVQVARYRREELQELQSYSEIRSYVIDTITGEGIGLGTVLPEVFWIDAELMLGAVTHPFPKVIVYGTVDEM